MGRIIRLLVFSVIIGYVGYAAIESYRGGFFAAPDMPEGSYSISFKNGLRGVVLDAKVSDPSKAGYPQFFRRLASVNPDRRYLGVPADVPSWFEEMWSFCAAPIGEERFHLEDTMSEDMKAKLATARLDAVCKINVDGKDILRGLLYSVPVH